MLNNCQGLIGAPAGRRRSGWKQLSEANFVQSESGGQDSEGRVGGQVPLGRGVELTGRRKVRGVDVSYFYWYSQSPLDPYFHHQILVSVPIYVYIYLFNLFV